MEVGIRIGPIQLGCVRRRSERARQKCRESSWFAVEHIAANIAGIVLLTIGNSKLKKASTHEAKDKTVLIFFGLGLLLILSRIPWERLF